jgi:hypothetical protein
MVVRKVPNKVPVDVLVVFSQNLWHYLLCIAVGLVNLHALFQVLPQLFWVYQECVLCFIDAQLKKFTKLKLNVVTSPILTFNSGYKS